MGGQMVWTQIITLLTQNIHIKLFLMRGQLSFENSRTWFLSCSNIRHFLMNFKFWLLRVEFSKSLSLSSLNFMRGYEKCQIGSCPLLLYTQESIFTFFSKIFLGLSKVIGVFVPTLLKNGKFEFSIHFFRGPCLGSHTSALVTRYVPKLLKGLKIIFIQRLPKILSCCFYHFC